MRVTNSVVFCLVSLVCSVNANRISKPIPAKRQATVTVTSNGCTSVCVGTSIDSGIDCEVVCDETSSTEMPATSISTSTSTITSIVTSTVTPKPIATSSHRTVVTESSDTCYETCSVDEAEGDIDCYFTCNADFSTTIHPTSTLDAVMHQRSLVSAVEDNCTVVCWDLMPGTECDVKCSSDSKTEMPVLSKAAHIANLEARKKVPARQVQEARLASKFGGLAARYETLIPVPSTFAWMPTVVPVQKRQAAGAPVTSDLLSQASYAISAVQQNSAESAVESMLSSMLASAPTTTATSTLSETTTEVATATERTTVLATALETTTVLATASETPIESSTSSKKKTTTKSSTASETTTESTTESETTTKSSTSSETITESTTTTDSLSVLQTSFPTVGAATQHTVSNGVIHSLLVGLAANILFFI